jgi:hypothetical protein
MKRIELTKGYFAMVDNSDYDWLSQYNWWAQVREYKNGNLKIYAAANINGKIVSMHRLIMDCPPDMEIDHSPDHYGLNNQRSNLRICTREQNRQNQTPFGKSKYLGVSMLNKKHQSYFQVFLKRKYLGTFKNEIEAAIAYDREAVKVYGEFANLNFKNGYEPKTQLELTF